MLGYLGKRQYNWALSTTPVRVLRHFSLDGAKEADFSKPKRKIGAVLHPPALLFGASFPCHHLRGPGYSAYICPKNPLKLISSRHNVVHIHSRSQGSFRRRRKLHAPGPEEPASPILPTLQRWVPPVFRSIRDSACQPTWGSYENCAGSCVIQL